MQHVTIDGFLPATFAQFCDDFIKIGSLFKQLYKLSVKLNDHEEYGSLYKVNLNSLHNKF